MLYLLFAGLLLLHNLVSATGKNVVYWGQNGGGTVENNGMCLPQGFQLNLLSR